MSRWPIYPYCIRKSSTTIVQLGAVPTTTVVYMPLVLRISDHISRACRLTFRMCYWLNFSVTIKHA